MPNVDENGVHTFYKKRPKMPLRIQSYVTAILYCIMESARLKATITNASEAKKKVRRRLMGGMEQQRAVTRKNKRK